MYEEAQSILDYLPIRRNAAENEYIDHLLSAFNILDSSDSAARPFALMSFHLLFMLAIQYKILRISRESSREYNLSFTIKQLRDHQQDVLLPDSPLSIASLNEAEIADLCKLIGLQPDVIGRIKALIRNRNENIAHARGGIESDLEGKINEYLACLNLIQVNMTSFNDRVANQWAQDISAEDDRVEFVESRLLDACLCPADFRSGELSAFSIDEGVSAEE